jgi:hypothetical protein
MPSASRADRAIALPIGPGPTTRSLVPAKRSVSLDSHTCARWSSNIRRKSFAMATRNPTTDSAIGCSAAPRALVSGTSLFTSAGKSTLLIPTFTACTQRSLPASGHAASRSSGSPHHVQTISASPICASNESRSGAYRDRPVLDSSIPGGIGRRRPHDQHDGRAELTAACARRTPERLVVPGTPLAQAPAEEHATPSTSRGIPARLVIAEQILDRPGIDLGLQRLLRAHHQAPATPPPSTATARSDPLAVDQACGFAETWQALTELRQLPGSSR